MENRQVVITGFKILSSVGWDTEDNTDVLYSRSSLKLGEITRYNIQDTSLRYGAQIPDKIDNSWDRKLKKYASIKDVGALSTIKQAWEESGAAGVYDGKRSSLYTGMGSNQVGDLSGYFVNVLHCLDDDFRFNSSKFGATLLDSVNPMIVMEAILNNTLCYGSKYLEFRGRNSNFMDWEAASFGAIHDGFYSIVEGRSDVAVVGGTCATLDPFNVMEDYHAGYYLVKDSIEDLCKNVKPYGKNVSGSIPVEGSCYFVLEERSQAEKRGANILGRICGIKSFCGKEALTHAIKSLKEERVFDEKDLCFVAGSGCGTPLDNLELEAVNSSLTEPTLMFSPRSSFYNMIEASTALATVSSLVAFREGITPPTLNYNDKIDIERRVILSSKSQDIDTNKSKALIPCVSRNGIAGALVLERIK